MTFAERAHDCFFAPPRELQPWCDGGGNGCEHTVVITRGNVLVQRQVRPFSVGGYSGNRFKCDTSGVVCEREPKGTDRSGTTMWLP